MSSVPICLNTISRELIKLKNVLKLTELSEILISLILSVSRDKLIGDSSSLKKIGNSLNGLRLAKNWYTMFLRT